MGHLADCGRPIMTHYGSEQVSNVRRAANNITSFYRIAGNSIDFHSTDVSKETRRTSDRLFTFRDHF